MLVKNWMRQPAITIDADDVVTDATTLLREHEIRMLPVMRKGKLVGIITDRDINIASASDGPFENMDNDSDLLSDIKINTIMTSDPVTVPYDYTLEETVEKFLVQNISGLPVVNEQQNVIGVIKRSDLFHLILILTGFGKKGLQIALDVQDRPGCLKKITDIIRDYGGRIASILSTQERADKGHRRLYIRVFDIDQPSLQHLRKILKEQTTLLYIVDYTRGQRELFGERKGIQNGRI